MTSSCEPENNRNGRLLVSLVEGVATLLLCALALLAGPALLFVINHILKLLCDECSNSFDLTLKAYFVVLLPMSWFVHRRASHTVFIFFMTSSLLTAAMVWSVREIFVGIQRI